MWRNQSCGNELLDVSYPADRCRGFHRAGRLCLENETSSRILEAYLEASVAFVFFSASSRCSFQDRRTSHCTCLGEDCWKETRQELLWSGNFCAC